MRKTAPKIFLATSLATAALVALTSASVPPRTPAYSIVPVATAIRALAINSAGVVAGRLDDGAFTWDGRRVVRYPPQNITGMDGTYTATATGVARDGTAVGHIGSYMPVVMSGMEVATAAIFRNGTTTFIDREWNGTFEADGVNDHGVIVGERAFRGFFRKPDGTLLEVQPLSTRPEGNGTRASAVDNEGRFVGGTTIDVRPSPKAPRPDESLPIHAFLASFEGNRRHMRDLGTIPGFPDSYATALNEDGVVVGYSGTQSGPKWTAVSGPSHAWVWQSGRMHDLGTLRARENSYAFGVDDGGTIVGCSGPGVPVANWGDLYRSANTLRAVRWVDKHVQDLNALIVPDSGWILQCARAINRSGSIVGEGTYQGTARAFLLVPARIEK